MIIIEYFLSHTLTVPPDVRHYVRHLSDRSHLGLKVRIFILMHIESHSSVGKAETTFQTTLRNPLAQYFSFLGSKIIVSDRNCYILHVSSLHQPHQTKVYTFRDFIICIGTSFPTIAA